MSGQWTSGLVGGLLTLFYPPHCGACGIRLADDDSFLCPACLDLVPKLGEIICPLCSHPMTGIMDCPDCAGQRWHLSVLVSGCRYEGIVRELVRRFKYGRDQSLVLPLVEIALPALSDPRLAIRQFDALVPVPLHPLRERERGFNQASLLADRLGKQLHLPVRQPLRRARTTQPQAGLDRKLRLKNLEGAFEVKHPPKEGESILLIDDVATTGTTLNACAEVLLDAGAGEVCALTVARG